MRGNFPKHRWRGVARIKEGDIATRIYDNKEVKVKVLSIDDSGEGTIMQYQEVNE